MYNKSLEIALAFKPSLARSDYIWLLNLPTDSWKPNEARNELCKESQKVALQHAHLGRVSRNICPRTPALIKRSQCNPNETETNNGVDLETCEHSSSPVGFGVPSSHLQARLLVSLFEVYSHDTSASGYEERLHAFHRRIRFDWCCDDLLCATSLLFHPDPTTSDPGL